MTEAMKAAKDIVWAVRTVWGAAFVLVFAALWVGALAQEVNANTKELEERQAVFDAIPVIAATLERIENNLEQQDARQREMAKSQARLEAQVENIEKELEE